MIDWIQRMERAKLNGKFADEDKELAKNWLTCATSERPFAKGRFGRPLNFKLANLGLRFDMAVQFDKVDEAAEILKELCGWNLPE